MPYDFSLDRKGAITLSAGSVVLLALVFVAGVLTGLTWRNPERQIMAAAQPAVPMKPATAAVMPPAPPKAVPPEAVPPLRPQPAEPAKPASPMPNATPAAASPAPAATPEAAPAAAPAVPAVQLAIQVGAFLDKTNADKLVERLKEAGYTPQIVLGGHAPRIWNFVQVGPYHDWGEASQIAAVISRDEETEAVVRPMH
ncbi:MAG TPA: SPOR domain-containing protein [Bryobacteraceae bacterium]|nr:SPOR domain-containing protein [Bryobacteraceae bacterium]